MPNKASDLIASTQEQLGTIQEFLNNNSFSSLEKEKDIQVLVKLQDDIKRILENIDLSKKTLNMYYDILRKNIVPELMDKTGVNAIDIKGLGKICLVPDLYASFKIDKKEAAFEWLSDLGYKEVITKSIHPGTLKKIMKDKIKEIEKIQDTEKSKETLEELKKLFSLFPFTYSKITRGRG